MRNRMLSLCAIFVTLLLFSCGKKEGVYNPERKIIMVETTRASIREVRDNPTDEWVFDDSSRYVTSEMWTWNGDKLMNIRYSSNGGLATNDELLEFEYDGDRIQRIVERNRGLRAEVRYDGRKVETISMYERDIEAAKATFSHKRGKVSSIEEQIIDFLCAKDKELFRRIIGMVVDNDPVSISVENNERFLKNTKSDNYRWYYEWLDFEWNGDNIEMANYYTGSHDKKYATYEYDYDDATNPYTGMTYCGFCGDYGEQSIWLNANNVTRKKTTYYSGKTDVQDFTYTYDNDWPLSKTNVEVDSNYHPAFDKYMKVTRTTVTRFTYQDND